MKKKNKRNKKIDFSKGVRGKYAKSYGKGTNIIFISKDLAKFFPDSKSVNAALRKLIKIQKRAA